MAGWCSPQVSSFPLYLAGLTHGLYLPCVLRVPPDGTSPRGAGSITFSHGAQAQAPSGSFGGSIPELEEREGITVRIGTTHKLLNALGVASGLVLLSASALTPAAASTATGTLNAQIVITSNCAVSTDNSTLDFASHASTSGAVSASNGGFSVTCTDETPYTIGLQSAATGSTNNGAGTMSASGIKQTIGYQLYQDASLATPWGNNTATSGGNVKSNEGSGAAQSYVVYGKTTSSLNVPAGTYSDTVNINVTY
ncbi:MAG: spore coat U domain-containing protein [Candidimonas sp.]|nr:MAG: spore coat U domain-containing protein [Candidimonas sp.]